MKSSEKSRRIIFGTIIVINILLTILRFKTIDLQSIQGNVFSTTIFLLIFAALTYYFAKKKYDYFILIWLSFYFASPIIVLPFTEVGSLGILNAIFVPLMIYKTLDLKNKQTSKYLIIILVLLLLSVLHIANSDIRTIISRVFLFITPPLFFYFALKRCEDMKLILWGSAIIALINIPLGIYQIAFHPSWGMEVDWRGARIFGNLFWHNSYSMYLLPVILTLYAFYKQSSKRSYLALAIALTIMDIFTFSRTGIISLIVSITIFELINATGFRITAKKMAVTMGAVVLVLLYINAQDSLGTHLQPGTVSERTEIWRSITPFLKGHLILGNGIGSYDLYRENFVRELSSHNSYLNILFEIGIVGLMLFLAFIYFIFDDLKQKIKSRNPFRSGELGIAILAGMLCYSVAGNAAFTQVVALNAWIMLACCVRYDEKN